MVIWIVEVLIEGKLNLEFDFYFLFDLRVLKFSLGGGSYVKGLFREVMVFMIGGGNYVEYGSL